MRTFEYKFEPLEEFIENTDPDSEEEGYCEINTKRISELGKEGFELFQIIIIDGIQHGWFKKTI